MTARDLWVAAMHGDDDHRCPPGCTAPCCEDLEATGPRLDCPRCGTTADRVHADGVVFRMSLDNDGMVALEEDGEIIDIVAECVCGTSARIMLDERRHIHCVSWEVPS